MSFVFTIYEYHLLKDEEKIMKSYYVELRTFDSSYIKVYWQNEIVQYADYKKDKFYIFPGDLWINGVNLIQNENILDEFF